MRTMLLLASSPTALSLIYSSKRIFIKYFYSRKSDLFRGVIKQAFIL
jgi:hypothetical protein